MSSVLRGWTLILLALCGCQPKVIGADPASRDGGGNQGRPGSRVAAGYTTNCALDRLESLVTVKSTFSR